MTGVRAGRKLVLSNFNANRKMQISLNLKHLTLQKTSCFRHVKKFREKHLLQGTHGNVKKQRVSLEFQRKKFAQFSHMKSLLYRPTHLHAKKWSEKALYLLLTLEGSV